MVPMPLVQNYGELFNKLTVNPRGKGRETAKCHSFGKASRFG